MLSNIIPFSVFFPREKFWNVTFFLIFPIIRYEELSNVLSFEKKLFSLLQTSILAKME